MVYEEIKDDIGYFVKLYKLAKAKGMGVQQVVDSLTIANNDLPAIEERFKKLRDDVSMLQSQKHACKRNVYQLNNQIATTSRTLASFRISYERERREIENLCNEKAKLESIVIEFKNNNEEYLKVKQAAEEKVKSVLTTGKILLKFATASVIESLKRNPELCNILLNDVSDNNTASYGSSRLSLISSEQQQSFNDMYSAVLLEEAEQLYNKLTTKLTNEVMATADAIRTSTLPSLGNSQKKS